MSRLSVILQSLWIRASVVCLLAFAFLQRLQGQAPEIAGYDGWFHARYAALLPSIGFIREFKWAAQSTWATDFADKEILFHVLLIPFVRFGDAIAGMKLAAVLLGVGVVVSFFLVLARNRFRYPEAWTFLLLGSGGYLLYRLCLPRPHLLSMILLLWSVHLILNRKRLALAVVIFLYALGYTAYHLPLALAVVISVDLFLVERKVDWKTPLAVLAGMTAGIVVNPYFPNNFKIFWAQNFVVPWMSIQTDLDLGMADELRSLATRDLVSTYAAIVLLCLGAVYLAMTRPRPVDGKTRALFLIAGIYLLLGLAISRFIEYAVPMTLLFLAAYFSPHLTGSETRWRWRRLVVAGVLACAIGGLAWKSYGEALPALRNPPPSLREASLYLKAHTEPDELVFTCDWDDSPQLFFFNDRNRYPVLMDPVLMYLQDPLAWNDWVATGRGEFGWQTYEMLARHYRYGVCTHDFSEIRGIVERDPRMEIVHDGDDAFVFYVDPDNPAIPLDRFIEIAPQP